MKNFAFLKNSINEKRSEERFIIDEAYNIKLSIDGFTNTYQFKIYDKSIKSVSILIDKYLDILSRIRVGDKLYMIYYPTKSSYPKWYLGTTIKHITKYDQIKSKSSYLVGLEILNRKRSEKDVKIAFSLSDNGGRRLNPSRRKFSYDAHIPERRSGKEQRNGKDRRNEIETWWNKVSFREKERRIAFQN